jgi:hypothetical protein
MTTAERPPRSDVARHSRVVLALLALGAALRLWQFGAGPALNLAEIALSRNVMHRPLDVLLTQPLALGQLAMPGYLVLMKAVTSTVGGTDYTLRLLPLAGTLLVLLFTWQLAQRWLETSGQIIAVGAIALGVPFIAFGMQVKPYGSVEVAGALAMILLGTRALTVRGSAVESVARALGGALLVATSQSAGLCAIGGALALIAAQVRDRRSLREPADLLVAAAWLGATALAWHAPSLSLDAKATAQYHELYAAGYLPAITHPLALIREFSRASVQMAGTQLLQFPAPALAAAVLGAGLVSLMVAGGRSVWAVTGTMLTLVLASSVQLYPFATIYLLSLVPLAFLGAGHLADRVTRLIPSRTAWLRLAWPLAWLAAPLKSLAADPPPYRLQEASTALAGVRQRWQPGDRLYAFFGARQAMRFYGPAAGFGPDAYQQGHCHFGAPREYLAELDSLRGAPRAWLFVIHDAGRDRAREEMLHYLDEIGVRRDSVVVTRAPFPPASVGAFAYLYDLSDPARLARTTARDVKLVREPRARPDYACGWGPIAEDEP